ncbi:MAG TPA: NADP-dependent oxidoreductase [Candidatus Acidoferrales bacterium]|nr:NADP-dependent oxidoreductase [Candidatus Acidoferrales bacterium]
MTASTATPLPSINRQFTLAARPVGMPKESDFRLVTAPIPALANGQLLLRTLFLSVDPYMRGRMNGVRTYADPVDIGQIMVGGTVGKVVQSTNPQFRTGDCVVGYWGWQEYAVSDGRGLQKLDASLAPVSTALGVLGMPGMTAYFGFLELCQPKPGETVVVSGAAGAVGSLVGQIAKIKGCRAVGIAGTDEKVAWITGEIGFDAAFNYKTTEDYVAKLKELCPNGIDCYFDNVGGPVTDAVLPVLNVNARISICGQISQYNSARPEPGVRPYIYLLSKQSRVEGFIVSRWMDRFPEGVAQMARWLKEGKLKYREQIVNGFENAPRALIGVLQGDNTGKMLVKFADA